MIKTNIKKMCTGNIFTDIITHVYIRSLTGKLAIIKLQRLIIITHFINKLPVFHIAGAKRKTICKRLIAYGPGISEWIITGKAIKKSKPQQIPSAGKVVMGKLNAIHHPVKVGIIFLYPLINVPVNQLKLEYGKNIPAFFKADVYINIICR